MNYEFQEFKNTSREIACLTSDGRFVLKLRAVNELGWILLVVASCIAFLGIYLIVLTTKGIKV
jgi:hypothetical protein